MHFFPKVKFRHSLEMCDDEKQGIWGNMQVFLLEGWNGGGVIYQT